MPKIKADIFDDSITYSVQSKSLTAAMERAIIIVEALGPRVVGFEYALDEDRKKPRHIFYIYA